MMSQSGNALTLRNARHAVVAQRGGAMWWPSPHTHHSHTIASYIPTEAFGCHESLSAASASALHAAHLTPVQLLDSMGVRRQVHGIALLAPTHRIRRLQAGWGMKHAGFGPQQTNQGNVRRLYSTASTDLIAMSEQQVQQPSEASGADGGQGTAPQAEEQDLDALFAAEFAEFADMDAEAAAGELEEQLQQLQQAEEGHAAAAAEGEPQGAGLAPGEDAAM